LNVQEVEPELAPLDVVPEGREAKIRYAMSNSFGFGGSNTSLIFGRAEPEKAQRPGLKRTELRGAEAHAVGALPRRPLVAVTGLGAVSPLGLGADELWDQLVAGASGLRASPPSPHGIQVPGSAATMGDVSRRIDDVVSPRFLRRLANFSRYAVGAASLCFQEAGREGRWSLDGGAARRDATAVILGTCFGCSAYHFDYYEKLFRNGVRDASPLLFSESVMNAASGHTSIHLKLRGASLALVGGEEVGLAAIADAADRIRLGEVTAALAGGAEEYCDFVHAWLTRRGYVTDSSARPYAGDEKGGFLGEGATFLLLEDAGSVTSTGGQPLAFVVGAGAARAREGSVATGTAEAVERAIQGALAEAELPPQAVDLVVSSAGGTVFDGYEAQGIAGALRTSARTGSGRELFIAAPKAALGEAFAFTSSAQALVGVKALVEGVVPPLPGLSGAVDLPPGLRLVSEPVRKDLQHALVVSVSTRGNAVAVLLSRTSR
jgi:nodulation protein E